MKKKCLAVGIILLFIGVAVAPSINFTVVKASTDNELVEVTTQACGIKGYGNTTVKLTRQQYQNLEQYLVDFRARLNQTSTREEAVPIFKEAVIELNKYGLLPKGMSIGQAQRLVSGEYLSKRMMNALEMIAKKHLVSNETNSLCLTVGRVHMPDMTTLLMMMSMPYIALAGLIMLLAFHLPNGYVALMICTLLLIPILIVQFISYISPFSMIVVGHFYDSNLSTFGLSGLHKSIHGDLFGFIGLKLWVGAMESSDEFFLLGFSIATRNY